MPLAVAYRTVVAVVCADDSSTVIAAGDPSFTVTVGFCMATDTSSSVIVPVPEPSAIVAFGASLRFRVNVSVPSARESSVVPT